MAGWISFISGILASKKDRRFLSGRFNDPDRPKKLAALSSSVDLDRVSPGGQRLRLQRLYDHARFNEVGWMILLHIGDHRFTNVATQCPQLVWVTRANQCTDLDRSFLSVSNHHGLWPPVPRRVRLNVSKKFLSEFV